MPFRFAISPDGVPFATRTITAASPSAAEPAHAHRCQFDQLPAYVIQLIADWLPDGAKVALDRVCKAAFAALDRDLVMPMRVAEAIRWTFSPPAWQRVVTSIWQCPAHRQEPLWGLARRQLESCHPVVRQRASDDQRSLVAPPDQKPGRTLRKMTATGPASWAAQLVHLVNCEGEALVRKQGTQQWLRCFANRFPSDRAATLTDVILACGNRRDVSKWRRAVDDAMRMAREMQQSPLKPCQDAAGALFAAVSAAIGIHCREDEATPEYLALWDDIIRDTVSLDAAARAAIMAELANVIALDLADSDDPPRWRRLIDLAMTTLPANDAADVLVALMEPWNESDFADGCEPMFHAVLMAAGELPDAVAQPLVTLLLTVAGSMEETPFAPMWHACLQAAADKDAAVQAPLLAKLAQWLPWVGDGNSSWALLADCIAGLPVEHRQDPLQSLIGACGSHGIATSAVVARLMPLVLEFDFRRRAGLLSAMLDAGLGRDAASRRTLMNAVGQLPGPYRSRALASAASDLLAWADGGPTANGWMPPRGTPDPVDASRVAPGPGDFPASIWPSSQKAALGQFHDLLAMLSLRDRGELLISLASRQRELTRSYVPRMLWILMETRQLPRTNRYEVKIYTEMARYAATSCPIVDVPLLLRELVPAVASLDPDHCASALCWLYEACLKAGIPGQFEPVKAAFGPEFVQGNVAGSLPESQKKRKADSD